MKFWIVCWAEGNGTPGMEILLDMAGECQAMSTRLNELI